MSVKNLIFLLTLIQFSCNHQEKQTIEIPSTEPKNQEQIVDSKSDNPIYENKFCFIKKVVKENGKHYIIVDYIDFLTGNKAIERAKKFGNAEYDISTNGDTTYYVYDDYYVSNINPKLRTLELAKDVKIELLDFSENPSENGYKIVSLTEFTDKIENNPIIILKSKNGIVMEMKEQFTP